MMPGALLKFYSFKIQIKCKCLQDHSLPSQWVDALLNAFLLNAFILNAFGALSLP